MSSNSDSVLDVIVVGGGVFGVWAAIAAAKKKDVKVALVEQFDPANDQGSSDVDAQIYRMACSDDFYVDMMSYAEPLWKELQKEIEDKIMAETGFLTVSDTSVPTKFNLGEALESKGIDYSLMDFEETSQRFPQIKLHAGMNSLFVPDGGILYATKCITGGWEYCEKLGVETHTKFEVVRVSRDASSGVVEVESADNRTLRGKHVILATGPWLSKMAKEFFGVDIPTHVTAETVCHYRPRQGGNVPDHSISSMPGFFFETDNGLSSSGYYGTPDIYESGITVGADCTGLEVDPEERPAAIGGEERLSKEEELTAQKRKFKIIQSCNYFVVNYFPHLEPKPVETETRLYTLTASRDYIISKVKNWGDSLVILGGGSGHGFKMGPTVGHCAVALAFGEKPPVSCERFTLDTIRHAEEEES